MSDITAFTIWKCFEDHPYPNIEENSISSTLIDYKRELQKIKSKHLEDIQNIATEMSNLQNEFNILHNKISQLTNIIIKYEHALKACEIALHEAEYNENCGKSGKHLTNQELAAEESSKLSEEVRDNAIKLGINLPKQVNKVFPFPNFLNGLYHFMHNYGHAVTFSYEFGNTDDMIKEAVEKFKMLLGDLVLVVNKDNISEKTNKAFLLDGEYNPNHGYTLVLVTTPTQKVTDGGPMGINLWNHTFIYGLNPLTDEQYDFIEDNDDYAQYTLINNKDTISNFVYETVVLYGFTRITVDVDNRPYRRSG